MCVIQSAYVLSYASENALVNQDVQLFTVRRMKKDPWYILSISTLSNVSDDTREKQFYFSVYSAEKKKEGKEEFDTIPLSLSLSTL